MLQKGGNPVALSVSSCPFRAQLRAYFVFSALPCPLFRVLALQKTHFPIRHQIFSWRLLPRTRRSESMDDRKEVKTFLSLSFELLWSICSEIWKSSLSLDIKRRESGSFRWLQLTTSNQSFSLLFLCFFSHFLLLKDGK